MKKRDLLLAGLILFNVSAFAQDGPTSPPRYTDDAKQIFIQDFEGSKEWKTIRLNEDPKRPTTLYTWQENPVDRIEKIAYYKKSDSVANYKVDDAAKFYSDPTLEIAGYRDSLILMYDGVMRTDAAWPDDSALQFDKHAIVDHDADSQHGKDGNKEYGLDRYGEDGGTQFFRYTADRSAGVANRSGSDGDHYVPEYRRNLFVRNLPIEDNSSYRVTVFVKPDVKATSGVKARLGLDLMRGYFHSEKSFIVNLTPVEEKNPWGGTSKTFPTFSDKTDYTDLDNGKWNKITLMAYYSNDSVGNASPYLLSYYWQTDWTWKVKVDENGMVANEGTDAKLRYIQQPAKYFVRLSFRSDSTVFDVDNLSLTKSWIGGVEYLNDMIRVDFGYQTNLGELAEKAKEENKIAAVQLPGKYFDVWALWREGNTTFWENVPILSAEYQGDGYMYMWTEPTDQGDVRSFDGADSVLVTFRNPLDNEALKLVYTGKQFPNGMDTVWIKEGKPVFDFHNEIASLNPTINISPVTKQPVKSLAELAPVLQKSDYEDGTFGLEPTTRELKFKFSKNLAFDDKDPDKTAKTKVILRGNGVTEYWTIKPYPADDLNGNTTIVRPDKYTTALAGDYVLSFEQVTHLKNPDLENSDDYGENVKFNYHFGDFEVAPEVQVVAASDWRSEITQEGDWDRPVPPSLYTYNKNDGFYQGTGVNFSPYKKNGLYKMSDPEKYGDCFMYITPYDKNKAGIWGTLYSVENLKAGNYTISFPAFGWGTNDTETKIYIYAKPAEMIYDNLTAAVKTEIGQFKPTSNTSWSGNASEKSWANDVKDKVVMCEYKFNIPANGDYVIEWATKNNAGSQTYYGMSFGNYTIKTAGDLSFIPVNNLNTAIKAAADKLAAAADAKYQGADFDALTNVKRTADGFIAIQKASMVNKPSVYAAETKIVNDAVEVLKLHMDTVDAFDKAFAAVEAKLAVYADSLKAFEALAVVDALKGIKSSLADYPYSSKAPGAIAADTKTMNDGVKAVEDRQAINDQFTTGIADAKKSQADPKATKYAGELAALGDAITAAEAFDAVAATDDELKTQISVLSDAKFALDAKILAADVTSMRIKALNTLATTVKADYGDAAADVASRVAAIAEDDDDLAKIMKSAIKVAIYDNIVNKQDTAKGLDLSAFIKNYHLYATPKYVERTDIKANDAAAKVADENGANIQHVQHQWNSGDLNGKQPIWIMILENDYETLYPGWTVRATATGNCMVTCDDDTYGKLKVGTPVFDAQLAMDWNGKAELKSSVEDLPLGIYDLSITLKQNTGSNTVLNATTSGATYEGKAAANDKSAGVKGMIVDDGKIDIDFILTSGSGWSQADNFKLTFVGTDAAFNYAQLLENAKGEFNKITTVIGDVEAADAKIEYFTLGGIQVTVLEKGQAYIQKITIGDEIITKTVFVE